MFAFLDIIQSECSKTTKFTNMNNVCMYIHCNVYLTFRVEEEVEEVSIYRFIALYTRIDYIMRVCSSSIYSVPDAVDCPDNHFFCITSSNVR